MPSSLAAADPRAACLQINERSPRGGLFEGDRPRVHPDSNLPWRISPEPFGLSAAQTAFLDALGPAIHGFYRASNLLYQQSVRGLAPAWIHGYLDQGKPAEIVELGRMNRFRSHLPLVMRPDLVLTGEGFRLVELDSVPGGMGFTAQVCERYAELGFDLIGGARGLVDDLYAAIAATAGAPQPVAAIVVSDESAAYRAEMDWLARSLRAAGRPVFCLHPRDLHFDERGLSVHPEEAGEPLRIDVVYRFFELFDLKNIPKAELIVYFAKRNAVRVTPPLKAQLEEKMWLALFWHPMLQDYWRHELGETAQALLRALIPRTWIVDPRPVPPHALIPDLQVDGHPIGSWDALAAAGKRQREFVLKPSGFSDLAYESRGVSVGHDLPEEEWAARLQEAQEQFDRQPYVLQEYRSASRVAVRYYDFAADRIETMHGRALVRPYYYLHGDAVRLAGVQAVVCPPDKKVLHGMADAVLAPCSARATQPPICGPSPPP